MQKRKIMIPLKETPPPVVEEEKPLETQGIDEEKIFKPKKKKDPKNASLEIQQVANDKVDVAEPEPSEESEEDLPPPPPTEVRRKHKPASEERKAHLARCREKSLETRRRKKQERELMLSRAQQIVEERDLEIKKKKQYMNERVVEQPPPMPQPVLPQVRAEPEPRQMAESISAVMDTRTQQINYDELSEKIYSKFKSDQQLSQMQQDIRREEQLKAQSSYEGMLKKFEEDQHRKYQRDMSYKMMAGKPNSVFMRSAAMQDRIRNRFK
jgi:hypothetical protein